MTDDVPPDTRPPAAPRQPPAALRNIAYETGYTRGLVDAAIERVAELEQRVAELEEQRHRG